MPTISSNTSTATIALSACAQIMGRTTAARREGTEAMHADHRELLTQLLKLHGEIELLIYSSAKSLSTSGPRSSTGAAFDVQCCYVLPCEEFEVADLEHLVRHFAYVRPVLHSGRPDVATHPLTPLVRRMQLLPVGNPTLASDALELLQPSHTLFDPDYQPSRAAGEVADTIRDLARNLSIASRSAGAAMSVWALEMTSRYVLPDRDLFRQGLRNLAEFGTKAYLAPVPRPLNPTPRDRSRWAYTLGVLSRAEGWLRISCRASEMRSQDRHTAAKITEALEATYAALNMMPREEFDACARVLRAVLARAPLFAADIQVGGPAARTLVSSVARDLDPETLVTSDPALEAGLARCQDRGYVDVIRRYQHTWMDDEMVALLAPPYAQRDALPGLAHYVVSPFGRPALKPVAGERAIVIGTLADGTPVHLTLADLNRHVFVTGAAGGGKSTTIARIVQESHDAHQLKWLIVDPSKTEFRDLLPGRNATLVDAAIDRSFRFNPFLCAPNVRVYDHAEKVARALTLLFPSNATAAALILYMVRETYLRVARAGVAARAASKYGDNGERLQMADVMELTGAELRDGRLYLVPTFAEFLHHSIAALEDLEAIGDNRWLRESIGYFRVRICILRTSIFARIMSPVTADGHPDRGKSIAFLFEGRHLLETGRLADDEASALTALLVMLLHEHRQSRKLEIGTAERSLPLDFLFVIDEAHRIVPSRSGPRSADLTNGPAEEVAQQICRLVAEIRSYGVAVVIGEQSPSKIAHDVLVNSSCKIVHRIVDGADKQVVREMLSLSEEGTEQIGYLDRGEAIAVVPTALQPLMMKVLQPARVAGSEIATPAAARPQPRCHLVVDCSRHAQRHAAELGRQVERLCDRISADAGMEIVVYRAPTSVPERISRAAKPYRPEWRWTGDLVLAPTLDAIAGDLRAVADRDAVIVLLLTTIPVDNCAAAAARLAAEAARLGARCFALAVDADVPRSAIKPLAATAMRVRAHERSAMSDAVTYLERQVLGSLASPHMSGPASAEPLPLTVDVIP